MRKTAEQMLQLIYLFLYAAPTAVPAALVVFVTPRHWPPLVRITVAVLASVIACFLYMLYLQRAAIMAGPNDVDERGIPYHDGTGWRAVIHGAGFASYLSVPGAFITAVVAGLALYAEFLVRRWMGRAGPAKSLNSAGVQVSDPSNPYDPPGTQV